MEDIVVQTLARRIQLGLLYDFRTDTFLNNAFNCPTIRVKKIELNREKVTIVNFSKPEEAFEALKINTSSTLNLLTNFHELKGDHAKFLTETVEDNSIKVGLLFEVETKKTAIVLNESFIKQNTSVESLLEATHFVTQIIWGLKMFFTFEYNDLKDLKEKYDAEQFLLSQLEQIKSNFTQSKPNPFQTNCNEWSNNLKISVYGDYSENQNKSPKSFEEALEIITSLSSIVDKSPLEIQLECLTKKVQCLGEKCKNYYHPMIAIDQEVDYESGYCKTQKLFRQLNNSVQKLDYLRDSLEGSIKYYITVTTSDDILNYIQDFHDYIKLLQNELGKALSRIRTKHISNADINLSVIFAKFYNGKFSPNEVNNFLEQHSAIRAKLEFYSELQKKQVLFMKGFHADTESEYFKDKIVYVFHFKDFLVCYREKLFIENKKLFHRLIDEKKPGVAFFVFDHLEDDFIGLRRYNNAQMDSTDVLKQIVEDSKRVNEETEMESQCNNTKNSELKSTENKPEKHPLSGRVIYSTPMEKDDCQIEDLPFLLIPCPRSNLKVSEKCSAEPRYWTCKKCSNELRRSLDDYVHCSCGKIDLIKNVFFKCLDENHGKVFAKYININEPKMITEEVKATASRYDNCNSIQPSENSKTKINKKPFDFISSVVGSVVYTCQPFPINEMYSKDLNNLVVVCPGYLAGRCKPEPKTWNCYECKTIIKVGEYFLKCHCGCVPILSCRFICKDSAHGKEFATFENEEMFQKHSNISLMTPQYYAMLPEIMSSKDQARNVVGTREEPNRTGQNEADQNDQSGKAEPEKVSENCCVKFSQGKKKLTTKDLALLKMPCPRSLEIKNGACGSESKQWSCLKCSEELRYEVTINVHCSCGENKLKDCGFKCTDEKHGGNFDLFEDITRLESICKQLRLQCEPVEENVINIVLFGETGVGKSTFINAFANYLCFGSMEEARNSEIVSLIGSTFTVIDDNYVESKIVFGQDFNEKEGEGISKTQFCKSYVFNVNDKKIRLIDTPGIGDTRGIKQDKLNTSGVVKYLSNYPKIHGICLLMKPNYSRLTVAFRSAFRDLLKQLHKSACRNIIFVFTNARSTFYKPGDTFPVLQTMLEELSEENPDLKIKLTQDTYFCTDNEAFRVLVLLKNDIKFDQEDLTGFSKSWIKSSSESRRLIDYVSQLEPHSINETVTLSNAASLIQALSKPLATATVHIQNLIIHEKSREKSEKSASFFSTGRGYSTKERQDVKALEKEQQTLTEVRTKLAYFVKKNAISAHFFDETERDLEQLYSIENYKSNFDQDKKELLEQLKSVQISYEKQLQEITNESTNQQREQLTISSIVDLAEDLYSQPISGTNLKDTTRHEFDTLTARRVKPNDVVFELKK